LAIDSKNSTDSPLSSPVICQIDAEFLGWCFFLLLFASFVRCLHALPFSSHHSLPVIRFALLRCPRKQAGVQYALCCLSATYRSPHSRHTLTRQGLKAKNSTACQQAEVFGTFTVSQSMLAKIKPSGVGVPGVQSQVCPSLSTSPAISGAA